jgi:DNA-binding MarR family transcriptional regulator
MHWFDAGRLPFPHTATIAKRMGTTQRNVQRLINSLQKKGMLDKVPGQLKRDPKQYDVRPLLLKLQPRAKEWAALQERPLPELATFL